MTSHDNPDTHDLPAPPAPTLNRRVCPGLPAEWVNAWLAAVGATVLDPRLSLSWTDEPSPVAVLHHPDQYPSDALAAVWPDPDRVDAMPSAPLGRKVAAKALTEAICAARWHPDAWTITSTLTDLETTDNGEACHGPFDPAAPGTTGALHQRLTKVNNHVLNNQDGISSLVAATLDGTSAPVPDNGLGFDIGRLPDKAANKRGNLVHPAVEVLAFFGMALLPVRGDGQRRKIPRPRQRGHSVGGHPGFLWPAWTQPLDRWGIDALLDAWHRIWRPQRDQHDTQHWRTSARRWHELGVHAAWETKPYDNPNPSDPTRGFASRPVRLDTSPAARSQ